MQVEVNYISLKSFANEIKEWIRYLYFKRKFILIAAFIGFSLGLLTAFFREPTYKGELTFVLSTENTPASALSAIANQFGLSFSNSQNAFMGENIIQLFQSKKMIQRALFQTIPTNGELIINQIGKSGGFFEKWGKKTYLRSSIPFTLKDTNSVGTKDSLIRKIYNSVLTYNLSIIKIEKQLNFFKIIVTSNNEYVSNFLPVAIANVTAGFYTEIKSSIASRNLAMLNHDADSIKNILNKRVFSSLAANDPVFNLNSSRQSARATAASQQLQANVLQQVYQTVLQNLAAAKVTLQQVTPVYQVIDEPKLSLDDSKPNKLLAAFTGLILAAFFCMFFLLVIKSLKQWD